MNRFLSAVLIFLFIFALFGCSNTNGETSLTTNKAVYNFDDTVTLTLKVNFDETFIYDDYFYIEYFDGEWKKCEVDYTPNDIAYFEKKQAKIKFKLSERAEKDKDKYRVCFTYLLQNDLNQQHTLNQQYTVYSNEFYIED